MKTFYSLLALVPLFALAPAHAKDLFKCKDPQGKTFYSDKPLPECLKSGQDKLRSDGLTKEHVKGELTDAEREREEEEKAKKSAADERLRQCRNRIRSLTTTYNKIEDIDAARDKELTQADDAIRGIQQKIIDTQALRAKLQKDADSYKGKKVPQDVLTGIENAERDLKTSQQLVISKRRELDNIRARYEDQKRLYGQINAPGATEAGICAADGKR